MKQRIVSGSIFVLIFLIFVILGGNYFIAFTSFLSILAYKEIISLKKYPNAVVVLGLISMLFIILLNSLKFGYYVGFEYKSVILSFVLILLPALLPNLSNKYTLSDAFNLLGKILFIGLSFTSLNLFLLSNRYVFLYLALIVMSNDIFAYLTGKYLGKTKISKISPNKTLEGFIGGNIAGLIVGVVFYLIFIKSSLNIFLIIITTIILNVACQVGDLLFSKIKRENNIKDFSNLIPGHGGILDRLDSILFTSLIYLLIIILF